MFWDDQKSYEAAYEKPQELQKMFALKKKNQKTKNSHYSKAFLYSGTLVAQMWPKPLKETTFPPMWNMSYQKWAFLAMRDRQWHNIRKTSHANNENTNDALNIWSVLLSNDWSAMLSRKDLDQQGEDVK